jgi:hypothetical protein
MIFGECASRITEIYRYVAEKMRSLLGSSLDEWELLLCMAAFPRLHKDPE